MIRPQLLLPDSEKNRDWQVACVKYYAKLCLRNVGEYEQQYKLASGELDPDEYTYLTNPHATNKKENKAFPAKLRNYPITPSTIGLLTGEKRKRPVYSFVNVLNNDVISRKEREIGMAVKARMLEMYAQELAKFNINPEEQLVDIDIAQIRAKAEQSYKDIRKVVGQNVLDFILTENDVLQVFQKNFLYWLCTSQAYSYRDVQRDMLVYKAVKPENFGFVGDESVEYVEDAEACAHRFTLSYSEIIDRFGDLINEMPKDEKESFLGFLEVQSGSQALVSGGRLLLDDEDMYIRFERENLDNNSDHNITTVIHVNFKAKRKQKFLIYTNEDGLEEKIEVPNDYVGTENEQIETLIINELWEGYEIDERFYLGMRKVPLRRGKMNNPSICKLLYNGKIKKIGNKRALSVTEIHWPYQHLVNFLRYKTLLTIAKSKDNLLLFPISLIPDNDEWDLDKIFYHIAADDILFVDDSDAETRLAMQNVRALNLNLQQYIIQMFNLIQQIKYEADEAVGIVPQRKAQTGGAEGLGMMQTAINQSATISEDLFAEFEEFQERDLNCLLDFGKYAYIKGKRAMYHSDQDKEVLLDLTGENLDNYVNTDYNIKVLSSRVEKDKIDYLRGQIQAILQNGGKLSTVAEILEHDTSFGKIKSKLKEIEALEEQIQQQNQKLQAENMRAIEEMKIKGKLDSDKLQLQKAEIAANAVIEAAKINAGAKLSRSAEDLADNQIQNESANTLNTVLEVESLKADERKNIRDNATKQYVADKSYDVAKENKP